MLRSFSNVTIQKHGSITINPDRTTIVKDFTFGVTPQFRDIANDETVALVGAVEAYKWAIDVLEKAIKDARPNEAQNSAPWKIIHSGIVQKKP